jgi:hypothetical protein
MKLFIKVVNGQTVDHPVFEENLLQAFPDGIPSEYEPFERIQPTQIPKTYEKSICEYVKNNNGVWSDSWSIREMTDEEKQIKTNELIENAESYKRFRLTVANRNAVVAMANSDLAALSAWNLCIEKLKAYSVISVDPLIPPLPKLPIMDESGKWVEPE